RAGPGGADGAGRVAEVDQVGLLLRPGDLLRPDPAGGGAGHLAAGGVGDPEIPAARTSRTARAAGRPHRDLTAVGRDRPLGALQRRRLGDAGVDVVPVDVAA